MSERCDLDKVVWEGRLTEEVTFKLKSKGWKGASNMMRPGRVFQSEEAAEATKWKRIVMLENRRKAHVAWDSSRMRGRSPGMWGLASHSGRGSESMGHGHQGKALNPGIDII